MAEQSAIIMSNTKDIDVGILNDEAPRDAEDNAGGDEEASSSPSSRFDVYKALKNAKFVGKSCVAGKADGTMSIP